MFGWSRRRKQLLEEFEAHIELEMQENRAAGMPFEEARRAAKKKFGNPLAAAEESREVWGGVWLERLTQDVRYAMRSLCGVPAYSMTLVAMLALGLGSVTTMLAIVESILIRPVALPNPEELTQIYAEGGASGMSASPQALSYPAIQALRRNAHSFVEVGGYNTMVRPVRTKDDTRITLLVEVTPEFFPMLGVAARLGRVIGPKDVAGQGLMVSDEFWHERMHADPHVVGATLMISGQLRTVMGVLPAGVHVPLGTAAAVVYLPIVLKPSGEDEFGIESAATIARVKPGVTRQQALADADSVFAHTERKHAEQSRHLVIRSYRSLIVNEMQRPLLALLGGVGVLLLIACANAANLQIGRAANRMVEMSVRSAVGASFGRLLQQLVTESVLLSLVGAVLGGGLAYAAIALVRHTYGSEFSRFDELAVRPMVIVATGVLAVLVGVAAMIAPMAAIRRQITSQFALKNVTRRSRVPGILVALQVALTCVLLVASGLFVRTLQSLENVRLGFDPRGVTTLVAMPENQKQDPVRSRTMETQLLHHFEALPGVQSVTMQTEIPFSTYNMVLDGTTEIAGRPFQSGDNALYSLVSTNFVRTSGISLLAGRGFEQTDEGSASIVALVNQAFVKKYLSDRDAIGATLKFHREKGETDADLPFAQTMTVVGVVENEVQGGDLSAPYNPMVYLDNLQLPASSFLIHVFTMAAQYAVRSTLPPEIVAAELRASLHRDAPGMVEMSLRPMEVGIEKSLGQRKLALRLVAGFGAAALVLSAVGIYGVLAYSVARRRREIGIRMALGSTRPEAAALVIRQAGAMVLLGLLPGLAGAWAAGFAVRGFLYGVRPLDGVTLVTVGGVLLVVAGCAASVPAIRAAMVDPMEALRTE
jgi:predicted permease